ncbi:SDR family oxidoreductase [Alteribacter aurantiacus]|uniref:SDR family oxidoreductase n=1 Tax=Alteribacter aurantiacus TaxID=254410 RepID=UPI0004156CD1|nr:SDR family oxidoreductase [Alteribacter aurantiacus]
MKDKVVVVTGGARGIGKSTVRMLIKQGAKAVAIARNENTLKDLKRDVPEVGTYACDVSDEEQVSNTFDDIYREYGRIDVLLNNAGVGVWKTVEEMSVEDWDVQLNTNLKGVFLTSRAVFSKMKEQGSGHIINVASDLGYTSIARGGAYCASKWGLLGLTGTLLKEGAPHGIIVSTVSPGLVATDFGGVEAEKKLEKGLKPETVAAHIIRTIETGDETGSVDVIVKPQPREN